MTRTTRNKEGLEMKTTFAARAGRWSAAHWKTATFGWFAFVAAAIALGSVVHSVGLTNSEQANGETARAEAILDRAGFPQSAGESVLVQSASRTVDDPAFRRTVASVVRLLERSPHVREVDSPYASGGAGQISADRHSALVQLGLRGGADVAVNWIQPLVDSVHTLEQRSPGFVVEQFGEASADKALNDTEGKDFKNAERLSVPVTFLILLVAFGAFVAAGVPVLLAFSAVLAAIGLQHALSHLVHASDATTSVILLMGMAVGVDYSLFYLKREREERRAGHGADALERAAATSGQAVLVSGATVIVSMAGMMLAGSKAFTSIGLGTMLVTFMAMVGSLTVLPALLAKLGDRVDLGIVAVAARGVRLALRPLRMRPAWIDRVAERRTLLQRLKGERTTSRFWDAVVGVSLRFPKVAVLATVAGLIVLALPLARIHTSLPSFTDLPANIPIVKTYKRVQAAFPGSQVPATVAIRARDVRAPEIRAAVARLKREALATSVMNGPIHTSVNPSHTVAAVDIPLAGNGDDAAAMRALHVLRSRVVPSALGSVPGVTYAVTGETAGSHDFTSSLKHRFPLVFAFVLGLAFLLLLVAFRSVVVPATAIVLNLLSVAAACGVLVWIFQDGHGAGPLNFHSDGGVVSWLPLFLFVVLFALSMDYHVFIVSRIKELVDHGLPTEQAVSRAVRSTAGTVTAAALVMVAVFAIFASLSNPAVKQLGVGLAVAILLDATVIRGVLLPATTKLLGQANWYLPRWLGWLPAERGPRVGGRPAAEVR